jgi:hypothetical protein
MANHRKLNLSAEQLRELYIDKHMSDIAIGKLLGVCNITVANWRRKFGIRREVAFNFVPLPADELKRLYVDEKQTMEVIAKHFGCCGESTVRTNIIRLGIAIDSTEVAARRLEANKTRYSHNYVVRGYRRLMMPKHPRANRDGYVDEHRYIAEVAMGRYLEPGEQVHHINLIKLDNRIENLAVLPSKGDHAKLHKHMERIAAYLCGFGAARPEPLVFSAPVFWGGRWTDQVDLLAEREKFQREGQTETFAGRTDGAEMPTVIN